MSDKEIKFIVGLFNPPTPGHLKMIITAYEGEWDNKYKFKNPEEKKSNTNTQLTTSPIQQPPLIIFPTYSHGPKSSGKLDKDPLDFDTKVTHLQNIIKSYFKLKNYPDLIDLNKVSLDTLKYGKIYINNTDIEHKRIWGNPFKILCEMNKTKYDSVRLICGQDRLLNYQRMGLQIFGNPHKGSKNTGNSSSSSSRFHVHGLLRDDSSMSATKIRENTLKQINWKYLEDYIQIGLPATNINKLYTNVSLALGTKHSSTVRNNRLEIIQKLEEEFNEEDDGFSEVVCDKDTTCPCSNTQVDKMKNIKEQAKKLKIRLTYERNGKRYKKTEKMLLRQINSKLKKNKK